MSQEYEDFAGGMSYRTLNGIDFPHISDYLDGGDETSKAEIFEKNQSYYIASADKTHERLKLARTRILTSGLSIKTTEKIDDKIYDAIRCIEKLKKEIKQARIGNEILKSEWYKKWHMIKLLPSTVEGILIVELIEKKIKFLNNDGDKFRNELLKEAIIHKDNAKSIFLNLISINENSDFKDAERSRIKGYNELALADDKLRDIEMNII